MQDYVYMYHGTYSTTLEVSCCKHPAATDLKSLWNNNRDSLLEYLLSIETRNCVEERV